MASTTKAEKVVSPIRKAPAPVILADNFPSKTHLLVTNLTKLDSKVISFSPNGDTFYVFNQSIFAQKYLPQYFKHSNYGSFVRQLNLYGFTSSRQKENNDVVVWSHQYFHRDRKDLLKNIKRTVKKPMKSTKPSHVFVTPSSTSTTASISSEEVTSSPNKEEVASGESFSRQVSSKGDKWLESEFTYLKEQNMRLEEKLNLLLKITMALSSSSLDEFHSGEKRHRIDENPTNSHSFQRSYHVLNAIHDHQSMLKYNTNFEPMPFKDENMALEADNNDSMKAFVAMMLTNEEKEENEVNSDSDSGIDDTPADSSNVSENSVAHETYEDELMAEAIHAILPNDHLGDDGDFNVSFEEIEETSNVSVPVTFETVINRAVDKSSGPDAVLSSDSYSFGRDIEEGNVPVGVHIVSAQAELIDDDRSKDDDSVNDRRAWRKKVMCMLSFIFSILVIVCIIVPAVVLREKTHRKKLFIDKPWQDNDSSDGKFDDDTVFDTSLSTANLTETRSGTINIFSDRPARYDAIEAHNSQFVPDDITLNIAGADFICSHVPPLL